MELPDPHFFVLTLALVGIVIIVAALLSGFIDRSDVPQVAVFLALGAIVGPAGLELLDITLDSQPLRVVATLSLVLVLFMDAVSLSIAEVRRYSRLAFLVLGPGTLLSAVLIGLIAWYLLDLPPAPAAILGAALASTDPIMLRGLIRRPEVAEPVRLALRLESGLNDAVLLPIIFISMAIIAGSEMTGLESARLGLELFLLGPGTGVAVGLLSVGALELVRRKIGVRRDYESLYSLGVAFAAYAAAESVHGSGFLAAFCAGLLIAALDVDLCDCFVEYGQTTAEMALLFTFILFGSSLIWRGLLELDLPTLLFVVAAVLARPIAFFLSLASIRMDYRSRLLIAWFGPRGLSSLLLILIPVFAGMPGSEKLFVVSSTVVLFSVALHGGSLMFLKRAAYPVADVKSLVAEEDRVITADGNPSAGASPSRQDRISVEEVERLQLSAEPVLLLDVRKKENSSGRILGALRLPADQAVGRISELNVPRQFWIIVSCA